MSPLGAAIIGFLAGIILVFFIEFIDTKLHIDDPVGASSVHGVCGIFGTLMTGLLAVDGGAFYGGGFSFFGAQCIGTLTIDAWAAVTGAILFFAVKKIAGLRVDKRIEEEGLDIYEHGESCFNLIPIGYHDTRTLLTILIYNSFCPIPGFAIITFLWQRTGDGVFYPQIRNIARYGIYIKFRSPGETSQDVIFCLNRK